jgi:hypothetical protein
MPKHNTTPQRAIERTPWLPGCYVSSTGKATPIVSQTAILYPVTRMVARTLFRVMHPQYRPPIQDLR